MKCTCAPNIMQPCAYCVRQDRELNLKVTPCKNDAGHFYVKTVSAAL